MLCVLVFIFFFFFNDTATTEIYTLSPHDALPIYPRRDSETLAEMLLAVLAAELFINARESRELSLERLKVAWRDLVGRVDRKSTRLNSSHGYISYAVFCLKKTNQLDTTH